VSYLVVKWLHIVSSTLLFGTGIGSAFFLLCATLQRDPRVVAAVARFVVIADWLFTATSIVVQPVTGFYLAYVARFPLWHGWVWWSTLLYLLSAVCWLPVIWVQMRLRDIAAEAARTGQPLPPIYARYFRIWFALGVPALLALMAVFYLMVAKPS
jgi:uncharacterized membrane protein